MWSRVSGGVLGKVVEAREREVCRLLELSVLRLLYSNACPREKVKLGIWPEEKERERKFS